MPGKYFILAKVDADDDFIEAQEANNLTSKIIYIGPDLVVSKIAAPASATRNTPIAITLFTRNIGGAPAAASTTRVFFSNDKTFNSGTDPLLCSIAVPSRPAVSAAVSPSCNGLIPAGAMTGTRFLIAVADSDAPEAVVEAREGTQNRKTKAITIG